MSKKPTKKPDAKRDEAPVSIARPPAPAVGEPKRLSLLLLSVILYAAGLAYIAYLAFAS